MLRRQTKGVNQCSNDVTDEHTNTHKLRQRHMFEDVHADGGSVPYIYSRGNTLRPGDSGLCCCAYQCDVFRPLITSL